MCENPQDLTALLVVKVRMDLPLSQSQSMAVLSPAPVITLLESADWWIIKEHS